MIFLFLLVSYPSINNKPFSLYGYTDKEIKARKYVCFTLRLCLYVFVKELEIFQKKNNVYFPAFPQLPLQDAYVVVCALHFFLLCPIRYHFPFFRSFSFCTNSKTLQSENINGFPTSTRTLTHPGRLNF